MESKKKTPNTTITRNTYEFSEMTGNVYESVVMLAKRSNQIAQDVKKELHKKIEEFSSSIDTMEEIYENREQIEVVRHYEQMPKPTLMATQEYLNGELYYRNPAKENPQDQEMEAMEADVMEAEAVQDDAEQPKKKSRQAKQ